MPDCGICAGRGCYGLVLCQSLGNVAAWALKPTDARGHFPGAQVPVPAPGDGPGRNLNTGNPWALGWFRAGSSGSERGALVQNGERWFRWGALVQSGELWFRTERSGSDGELCRAQNPWAVSCPSVGEEEGGFTGGVS